MEEEVRPKALMIPFDKFVILDILPPEQYKNVVTQMRQYVELNREPEELQPIERMAFEALRPFMNENIKTYKRKIDAQHTNGSKGGRPKKPKEPNETHGFSEKPNETHGAPKYKVQSTKYKSNTDVLERDGDADASTTPSPAKSNRFHPPDAVEVKAYFAEKGGSDEQAQRFMDFYTSNGWKVGKNQMKSWKAAASGWISRDKERQKASAFQRNPVWYVSRPPEEAEKAGDFMRDAPDRTMKWLEKRKKEEENAPIQSDP